MYCICVYGAAREDIAESYKKKTEEYIGNVLQEKNAMLIFGAGGTGLMGAAARGAHNVGAEILGIAPSYIESFEPLSEYCDKVVKLDSIAERKTILESLADEYYILPGGVGTFDEFFEAVVLRQLDRQMKPITLVNIDGYYDDLLTFIQSCIDKGFVSEHVWQKVNIVNL